jgi:hypothetical protein
MEPAVPTGATEKPDASAARKDRRLRAVYRRELQDSEHELDLRRQDEFLFMQQETLVVQQAELLRLNEELETIARLDALTGLGNRLRLNEDLAQTAARIERNGGTVGLLLMDLDRFKRASTTPWATWPATPLCGEWPTFSARPAAWATGSIATAARSSWSCCTIATRTPWRRPGSATSAPWRRPACPTPTTRRGTWSRPVPAPASSRSATAPTSTRCSMTPTRRCTSPRRWVETASR